MPIDHATVIADEAARIIAAFDTDPTAKVPWSDRWTVGTVARHISGTHHVVAQIIAGRPDADFGLFQTLVVPGKDDPGFSSWFAAGTAALVAQVRTVAADEPCWSWYRDGRRVGFWLRRMAHETLVHRWDAEAAVTTPPAMEPEVAADGVDEFLDVFAATSRAAHTAPAAPSMRFECTDTAAEWTLQFPEPGVRSITREPLDSAVRLRGTAEGLLLFVWGRLAAPAAGLEVSGDSGMIARWPELVPPM